MKGEHHHNPTGRNEMSVLYDQEADRQYREGMRESIREIRLYAEGRCLDSEVTPELARAIWLVMPAVRWGRLGDEQLNVEILLDQIAAHEFGGYHGFSAKRIEDEADHIVGLWFMDQES
jgi:hypothetical protein